MSYRSSVIKSVQYGTITFADGDTSKTATITAVVAANAYVQLLGIIGTEATFDIMWSKVVLTNATTVTASRITAGGTGSSVVSFVVVEYLPSILKSNQDYSVSLSGAGTPKTGTATIASVNTGKTVLIPRGYTKSDTNATPETNSVQHTLTNATTVTATIYNATTGTTIVSGTALEFK